MPMRTFAPWIGSKYWSDGIRGVRVLILGESHYGEAGTECSSFTTEVVQEWGKAKRHRFFTVVQKLVGGLPSEAWVPDRERELFWEHVAFYNFVQEFPGDSPRMRPTEAMWTAAVQPFLQTIEELKPNVMIVLGLELHAHIPDVGVDVRVCVVQHPSSRGFKYSTWQPHVQDALDSARI